MEFKYEIKSIDKGGSAIVVYSHKELGEAITNLFLPIHRSPDFIEKFIIKNLPRGVFRSRHLQKQNLDTSQIKLSGNFETELDDQFYENLLAKKVDGHRIHLDPCWDVSIFRMNQGEVKTFTHEELTRNLELPIGIEPLTDNLKVVQPLFTIPVFTKGAFAVERPGKPPIEVAPFNQPTFSYLDVEDGGLVKFTALEDNSEYHCLFPRSKEPEYWERQVYFFENSDYIPDFFKYEETPFSLYVAIGGGSLGVSELVPQKILDVETDDLPLCLRQPTILVLLRNKKVK